MDMKMSDPIEIQCDKQNNKGCSEMAQFPQGISAK